VPEIVVIGGYGGLGALCVRELLERTDVSIRAVGRSAQRAERLALAFGERVTGEYLDADDERTLGEALEGADLVLACSPGLPVEMIRRCIEAGVPFVSAAPMPLDAHVESLLAASAWKAGVPVVLQAGAVPGLPSMLAEYLMRRFETLDEIRIASTGPWQGTATAQTEIAALRIHHKQAAIAQRRSAPWTPSRWMFPGDIGRRLVRPVPAPALDAFAEAHCVERVLYLEPDPGFVARSVGRVIGAEHESGFALVAEAYAEPGLREPVERVTVQADSPLTAAAVAMTTLVPSILADKAPAGLLEPRELLNPARFLERVAGRGVGVSVEESR